MKLLKKLVIVFCVLCILSLSGCTKNVRRYNAYTVYPIGYLLERIGADRVQNVSIQTNSIVQVAQINDDYYETLKDANYLFHIGYLEPYLSIYEEEIAETGVTKVDLSTLNSIYKFQRYTLVYVDGVDTYIEGPYYEGDIFKEIDTDTLDYFLWLDPIGMLSMAKDVYNTLAENYVEQSAFFKTNYDELEAELISLDAAYQSLAQKVKSNQSSIKFVSMSASFGYWQKAYGFQVYPVCLSKYGALPSKAQLEAIKKRIVADGVKYIAYEPNMTDEMLVLFNELVDELGLIRVNLSNISSLTVSQMTDNKDYMSLMYENLSVLENMIDTDDNVEEIVEEIIEEQVEDEQQ